ncbi:MAG: cytochrome c oxidase assembly protein [Cellulomonadaceae bacterium]
MPRNDPGSRLLAPALAAAVLCAVVGVVLGGLVGGIFTPGIVSDPGPLIRWALPVTTVLAQLATAVTTGGLTAVVGILPRGRDASTALLVTAWAAGAWTLLALAELVLTFADILGGQRGTADFGGQLGSFVAQVPLGRVLLAVVLIAALVSVLALAVRTPTGAAWTLALALVALVLVALTGHSSGAANHNLAVSGMFLHLVGAAVWVGTLGALAVVRWRGGLRRSVVDVVRRFSAVALWCYALVAVSGVVSAVIRVGGWDGLRSAYGALLAAKLVLLLVLGTFGWLHRRNVARGLAAAPDGGQRATWLFWRLALVELMVMGAVSGVAAALGRTQPPVPDTPPVTPTPAEIVTGELLPPPQTGATWFTQWRLDVLMACVVVAGLVVYTRWFVRLRRRGDSWPLGRVVSWWAGMIVLAWVTSGGPAVYGHVLFSAHMVQHMVLAMVIPIFLVMAAPVTLALRALPARKDGSRGPREWLLTLVSSRWGTFFANPLVAAVNFAGSMIVFYYTPLFEWSLTTHVGHLAMIAHFSLAGYLFANALIGIDPGPRRPGYPLRLVLLFATMAFHAFFGVTLVSSEALLVPEWFGLLGRDWGPTAIADQQIGGSVAWGIGEIPTMILAIVVAVRWSRDDERAARRRDRRVEAKGDTELDDYNAMLADLAKRDG